MTSINTIMQVIGTEQQLSLKYTIVFINDMFNYFTYIFLVNTEYKFLVSQLS